MKHFYTFIFSALSAGVAMAQPILLEANNAPEIGESFSNGTFVWDGALPTEGADQTWDYSSLSVAGTVVTSFYEPEECAAYTSFPEANIASTSDGMNYGFNTISSEGSFNYGYYTSGGITMYYANPEQQMTYPFFFGDSFSDDFHSVFVSGTTWNRGGTTTVSAVGYGTLTLPESTIDNVMLVKMEQDYGDTTMGTELYHYNSLIYQFFREGYHYPVLSFSELTIVGGVTTRSGLFSGDPTLLLPEEELEITVFPNPVQERVFIQGNQSASIQTVQVYSAAGELIYSANGPVNEIYTADWEQGVYIVQITTENSKKTERLIKT